MYTVDLAWKNFNVNLDAVEVWMKANAGGSYLGNSADADLSLHFSAKPDDATLQHIQDYWDALSDSSTEVTTYASRQTIVDAVASLRLDAATKTWDQLSAAQRKLVVGLSLTRQDLGV